MWLEVGESGSRTHYDPFSGARTPQCAECADSSAPNLPPPWSLPGLPTYRSVSVFSLLDQDFFFHFFKLHEPHIDSCSTIHSFYFTLHLVTSFSHLCNQTLNFIGGGIILFGLFIAFRLFTCHTFIVCLIMNRTLCIISFKFLSITRQLLLLSSIYRGEKTQSLERLLNFPSHPAGTC